MRTPTSNNSNSNFPLNPNLRFLPFVFVIVFFCNCNPKEINISPPKMWGDLQAGSYQVGFKTLFTYDITKTAVPYSDWDGQLFPLKPAPGRQMQINIWYPAKPAKQDRQLHFNHYINLLAQQTDFSKIDQQKKAFAAQQFINKTNALGGNDTFTAEKLDSLMQLKTFAFLDAAPVNNSFPLIVFPNGGSPAFQSIMCEYLASHGFIVAAMAAKGLDAFTDEASFRGIEVAVQDIDFTIRQLIEMPFVNQQKIGMIGNAISSSQIVAYASRNSNINCIVSLEGGLISSYEQNILKKTAFYNPESVDVPILAIYAPHPSIDPVHIFPLKYAERYFFHFPGMTEFHMLNYGLFDRFVPNIIGEHQGDVGKGFEWAAVYTLRFFEAYLLENPEGLRYLKEAPPPLARAHIDTFFIKKAIEKPPSITAIKNVFNTKGFAFIDSIYREHKKFDTAPFSKTFYSNLKDWLAWKKDPLFENRFKLYQLAYDSYPNSAVANYYLSYYALQAKKPEVSRLHNQKALNLLTTNNDEELTAARKEEMRKYLESWKKEY